MEPITPKQSSLTSHPAKRREPVKSSATRYRTRAEKQRFGTNYRLDRSHSGYDDECLRNVEECFDILLKSNSPATIGTTMHHLVGRLNERRLGVPPEQWLKDVERIRRHPGFSVVHKDPFSRRAFEKPRGYAGDAVMMDYIYGIDEGKYPETLSPEARAIFDYTARAASSSGVRSRREEISLLLDSFAVERPKARILAVASGHMREADISSAVRRRRFSTFQALDADVESLSEVSNCYGKYGVSCQHANVALLIAGRKQLEAYDMIYSTGLFDYLNYRSGSKLASQLFAALNPRGKLVLANFMPTIRDIGYMEACMDWFLIYRDRQAMASLLDRIPPSELGDVRIWAEENQNVVFIEIEKRG